MGTQYGPYVMYILSQMMKKRQAAEQVRESQEQDGDEPFAFDETGCLWHRQENLELLRQFCPEGYEMAKKYGHFLIGKDKDGGERNCIAIPGRFLLAEQPAQGRTGFTLWQPLKGGEAFYEELSTLDSETTEILYGYWIAALDRQNLHISEV